MLVARRTGLTAFILVLTVWWGVAGASGQDSTTTQSAADSTTAKGAVPAGPDSASADSTGGLNLPPLPPHLMFPSSRFNSISYDEYARKQSFSFDHFMETTPGWVIGRLGPIGAEVFCSRYGIGAGRATVYMAGMPVNDPQNDLAPLALLPASAIGGLQLDPAGIDRLPGRSEPEGVIRLVEREPEPGRPFTTFDLSKGTNLLRQRRVRFGSASSRLGLDLGYDELLNSGYQFDARQRIGGPDYGLTTARFHTMNLRGELPNDQSYLFSFRWFRETFQGDLTSSLTERRRSGQFAVLSTSLRNWQLKLFQRNYDVSLPDSNTVNHTSAVYLSNRPWASDRVDTRIGFGLENIDSKQAIGGAASDHVLRRGSLGGLAVVKLNETVQVRWESNLGHHLRGRTGWGGRMALAWQARPGHRLSLEAARSFRLPNLGERFLPLHHSPAAGIDRVVGNRYLDPELMWEAGLKLYSRLGFLTNDVRWLSLLSDGAIDFREEGRDGESWLVAGNGDRKGLGLLVERFEAVTSLNDIEIRLDGGLTWAVGDRTGYFAAVPRTRVDAVLSFDRDFFQETSGLRLTAEYQYSSERQAAYGVDSPAYSVLNLKLGARLLEADLFIHWLNITDELYSTEWPYLMTPRTFVYGIQWTLFN